MRIFNRLLLSTCVALLLGMALISGTATAASEPIDISWWHSMGGELGEEVQQLADQFNQSQSKYKVVPVYKGVYSESLTQAIAALSVRATRRIFCRSTRWAPAFCWRPNKPWFLFTN